jgi:hypothetical protein
MNTVIKTTGLFFCLFQANETTSTTFFTKENVFLKLIVFFAEYHF